MPFGIRHSGNTYKVVNKNSGHVFGAHDTEESAKKQLAAININYYKENEQIVGGLADNKTAQDIANKHNVSLEHITQQINIGMSVEMEHTSDPAIAHEICMDHLWENPSYYDKLEKAGLEEFRNTINEIFGR
jgi:hypothetical protein